MSFIVIIGPKPNTCSAIVTSHYFFYEFVNVLFRHYKYEIKHRHTNYEFIIIVLLVSDLPLSCIKLYIINKYSRT